MTIPSTTICFLSVSWARFIALRITAMISEPMSVLAILPSPPDSEVPPTTTAEMTINSYCAPVSGSPVEKIEVGMMPPRPAKAAQRT